jgi:hypothetical protein
LLIIWGYRQEAIVDINEYLIIPQRVNRSFDKLIDENMGFLEED